MENAERYANDVATALGFTGADHSREAALLFASVEGGPPYDWDGVKDRLRQAELRDRIAAVWPDKSDVERAAILEGFSFPA